MTDDLDGLLAVLPPAVHDVIRSNGNREDLIEVVLDLGRPIEVRYFGQQPIRTQEEATQEQLDFVVERVSGFTEENRAGIQRTLHRISAMRNRHGRIVGITARVGRAVYGTIDIIKDIVTSEKSVLLLGRPGVGKTTMLREVARVLADEKRVIIVDTSNEIGGDGDIPHPAVGMARRMQVSTPTLQHAVMIEAVENHMPEVIVVDEIGTELDAAAARTIAERGVQLVGTAHGNALENIMMNPTLMDLVGGIQSVTLSDEEARRRGTQKSILERKAPPTFDVLIEIVDRGRLAIHHDVAAAVDALLRARPLRPQIRYRDEQGQVHVEQGTPEKRSPAPAPTDEGPKEWLEEQYLPPLPPADGEGRSVYLYGVGHTRFRDAAMGLRLPVRIARELDEADALMTLRSHYRRHPAVVSEAERRSIPVYVLRSNSVEQIRESLATMFHLPLQQEERLGPLEETQAAIRRVLQGTPSVELAPQTGETRRQQHVMAREASLLSYSLGSEPYRRVRISRPR